MTEPLRSTFDEELEAIKSGILIMSNMVVETIPKGTEALLEGNLTTAQEIIEADDELDALSVSLEERCYQILTLQQPLAGDLRAVMGALWMNNEIERAGDLMTNIAKATRRIFPEKIPEVVSSLVQEMSNEAQRLLNLSSESYLHGDSGLAAALDDIDDRLDDLNVETVEAIFEKHNDKNLTLNVAVQLALICRYYERIGDHAVNIGERVRYIVDGWTAERTGAARLTDRQKNK